MTKTSKHINKWGLNMLLKQCLQTFFTCSKFNLQIISNSLGNTFKPQKLLFLVKLIVVFCCKLNNTRVCDKHLFRQVGTHPACYQLPIFNCTYVHPRSSTSPLFRFAIFRWRHESQWAHISVSSYHIVLWSWSSALKILNRKLNYKRK